MYSPRSQVDTFVSFKPNPVEPDSLLKSTVSVKYTSNDELRKILHKDVVVPTLTDVPRRRNDDGKPIDLPKLPVRAQEKRQRLPPTLSGLHQPPPNAGLLPSISVDKPSAQAAPVADASKRRGGRNRWSDEETRHLVQGVSRFGIGNWTKILNCPDYKFVNRTGLDLKDRFRVCFPEQYGGVARPSKARAKPREMDLGTRTHFPRSTRRQRHEFTAAEDERLLQGFEKYGKSWSSIQQDVSLGLTHRTRTDLRDRVRNRYPDLLKANAVQTVSWPMTDPYDIDYDQAEQVTLDRGILDWPFTTREETSLPSLASVTQQVDRNVRELPALAQFLTPPLEIDQRSNAHAFLSLDELLS